MTEYRNEKLIKELENEVEENECGVSDCCWCFCCGIFGLVCILPKYNKRKLANDRLLIELRKPKRPQQDMRKAQRQHSALPTVQQHLSEQQASLTPPPPDYIEKTS